MKLKTTTHMTYMCVCYLANLKYVMIFMLSGQRELVNQLKYHIYV